MVKERAEQTNRETLRRMNQEALDCAKTGAAFEKHLNYISIDTSMNISFGLTHFSSNHSHFFFSVKQLLNPGVHVHPMRATPLQPTIHLLPLSPSLILPFLSLPPVSLIS